MPLNPRVARAPSAESSRVASACSDWPRAVGASATAAKRMVAVIVGMLSESVGGTWFGTALPERVVAPSALECHWTRDLTVLLQLAANACIPIRRARREGRHNASEQALSVLILVSILSALLGNQSTPGANADTLAVTNVSVLPMDGSEVLDNRTVVIADGRIVPATQRCSRFVKYSWPTCL